MLEVAEGGHLALGLVGLGGLGERLLGSLAGVRVGQTHLGPWPGWSSRAQAQLGLPQQRKDSWDGAESEVTDLGNFEQNLRASCFEAR